MATAFCNTHQVEMTGFGASNWCPRCDEQPTKEATAGFYVVLPLASLANGAVKLKCNNFILFTEEQLELRRDFFPLGYATAKLGVTFAPEEVEYIPLEVGGCYMYKGVDCTVFLEPG